MAAENNWQQVQLTNFTAGIVTGTTIDFLVPVPISTAQPTAVSANILTHGCIALPEGGLAPLPAVNYNPLPNGIGVYTSLPRSATSTGFPYTLIAGSCSSDWNHRSFFIGIKSYIGTAGHYYPAYISNLTAGWNGLADDNDITDAQVGYLSYMPIGTTLYYNAGAASAGNYEESVFYSTYSPRAAELDPYVPAVRIQGLVTTDSGYWATSRNGWAFPHQGRLIYFEAGSGQMSMMQYISYTDPPLNFKTVSVPISNDINSQQLVYQAAHSSSIGAFGSFNATDALVVTCGNGGFIISGDLFQPYISAAPGIQSTNGAQGGAAVTPLGLVYFSDRHGIWAWDGGGTSTKLSTQLSSDVFTTYYNYGASYPQGLFYNIFYHGNMIYVNNSWMFNMDMNSWWRYLPWLADDPMIHYGALDTTGAGRIDGLVACPASPSTNNRFYSMTYDVPGTHYVYASNMLYLQDGMYCELQELEVRAYGSGTLTITLQGQPGSTTSYTITVSSQDVPNVYRIPVKLLFSAFSFNIESTFVGGGGPYNYQGAPIIHGITLNYLPRYPIRITTS